MKKGASFRAAFSLVEISLALGLIGFCLVALFGLLPIGLNSNQTTAEESTAANLATSIAADIWDTPKTGVGAKKTPRFDLSIDPSAPKAEVEFYLDESGGKVTDVSDARYRAKVITKPPEKGKAMLVRIIVAWPGGVPVDKNAGYFDTIIAVN